MIVWDAREDVEEPRCQASGSPLLHSLRVQPSIVAKKWDPGILDPVPFSGQIRKVEATIGKLANIRKVETD